MPRPNLSTVPEWYRNYVNQTSEVDALLAIEANTNKLIPFLDAIDKSKWTYRYADGKWSIKEMVQHLIDAERIFSYRALCISRGDTTSLPGFDENNYAAASKADSRTPAHVVEELEVVRQATQKLFASFDDAQLSAMGTVNGNSISTNSIGFIIAGHVQHHLNILTERYL